MSKETETPAAHVLTPEEQAKGGEASGTARRRKKEMKAAMRELLQMPVTDTDVWNKVAAMGIDPANIDNQTALLAMTLKAAILSGDYRALQAIRAIAGEDTDTERLKLQKKELTLKEKQAGGGGDMKPPVIIIDFGDEEEAEEQQRRLKEEKSGYLTNKG